jgi:hypothetical protein
VWLLLRGIVLTNLSDQWRGSPGHTARNMSVKIFAAFLSSSLASRWRRR